LATNTQTLSEMRGKLDQMRRGLPPSLWDSLINDRIRQVLDRRPYWADLIVKGILSCPNAYNTGTINTTTGSTTVTGTSTAWPVSDVVNGTIPAGIFDYGYQEVTPNLPPAQLGITNDSILYVDAGGTPEIVPVVQVTPYTFFGNFTQLHNAACTITQSSLVNRQMQSGSTFPIFTVTAVQSSTQLSIDQAWGGAALTAGTYIILKMYFTLIPNLKEIFWVIDQNQGIMIDIHIPVKAINYRDPQRMNTGNPVALVDHGTNLNGLSIYELWPAQSTAYQLQFSAYQQWPNLVNDNDRPPWFLNPNIFIYGALADGYRYKRAADDPWFIPQMARDYEARMEVLIEAAIQANDSKLQSSYTWPESNFGYPPGNYRVSHDFDLFNWNM